MKLWGAIKRVLGFGPYPNCRCCGVAIERDGFGIFPLGVGFCVRCVTAILKGRRK